MFKKIKERLAAVKELSTLDKVNIVNRFAEKQLPMRTKMFQMRKFLAAAKYEKNKELIDHVSKKIKELKNNG